MPGEQPPPIVPLVKEQADGVAFAEADLELQPVLANRESFRGGFSQHQLRRSFGPGGAAHVALQDLVVASACRRYFCQTPQCFPLRWLRACALCDNRKSPSRSTYQPGQPSLAP